MQAKAGREHILKCITDTIAEPRPELKPHVPRIEAFEIPKEFIGAVIGPGGKIIQQMQEDTGATITIDEEDALVRFRSVVLTRKASTLLLLRSRLSLLFLR